MLAATKRASSSVRLTLRVGMGVLPPSPGKSIHPLKDNPIGKDCQQILRDWQDRSVGDKQADGRRSYFVILILPSISISKTWPPAATYSGMRGCRDRTRNTSVSSGTSLSTCE